MIEELQTEQTDNISGMKYLIIPTTSDIIEKLNEVIRKINASSNSDGPGSL